MAKKYYFDEGNDLTFGDGGTANTQIHIDGAAGGVRDITMDTAASNRWIIRADGEAESGSDAGSNFEIHRCDDSGSSIDKPIEIERSSGNILLDTAQLTIGSTYTDQALVQRGNTAAPGLAAAEDPDCGIEFGDGTNLMYLVTAGARAIKINATGEVSLPESYLDMTGNFIEFSDIADPDAPSDTYARLYAQESGGGKAQIVVRFNTGAVQVIATEP